MGGGRAGPDENGCDQARADRARSRSRGIEPFPESRRRRGAYRLKIAIVGIGGVGGYFGGKLAVAGVDTVFIARGETLKALRSRGLRVDSINGDFFVDDAFATDNPSEVGPVDAVIFATKAWQTADAAVAAKPLVGPDTVVAPLQNGMDGPDDLAH